MIPILLVALMQTGGAFTHLPKLKLYAESGVVALTATGPPPNVVMAGNRCSVHMPRMPVPNDVKFQLETIAPVASEMPIATVPAPECPAAKAGK